MPRKTITPASLDFQPRPTYPYSPGAMAGGLVFTAGQVAWDETGNVTAIGDVRGQTVQTLKNVVAVLTEAGASIDDVDADDVEVGDRTLNSTVFGNMIYAVNRHADVGFELSHWRTDYRGSGDADDLRFQVAFKYKF